MDKNAKIFIAGHKGLVGSAIVRKLTLEGYDNLLLRSHSELDLENQMAVDDFFKTELPEYVFLAAARVGGILANSLYPADFIYNNIIIQTNVINSAYKYSVKKLLFLGSSCIYPKHAPQPLKEEYLLSSFLEPTNEPYAIAKIAGIKMCQAYNKQFGTNFVSAMPTNLYGINDNFHPQNAHVLPALIRKFHEAKNTVKKENRNSILLWGSGTAKREFLYVDDFADACVFIMNNYNDSEIINVGTGRDISIKELACLIRDIVRYPGKIEWDRSVPDGTPKKLLDVTKLTSLGWVAKIKLKEGIRFVYDWFCEHYDR